MCLEILPETTPYKVFYFLYHSARYPYIIPSKYLRTEGCFARVMSPVMRSEGSHLGLFTSS